MPKNEIPKTYKPKQIEDALYGEWESSGLFKPNKKAQGEPFSIAMPPFKVMGRIGACGKINRMLPNCNCGAIGSKSWPSAPRPCNQIMAYSAVFLGSIIMGSRVFIGLYF